MLSFNLHNSKLVFCQWHDTKVLSCNLHYEKLLTRKPDNRKLLSCNFTNCTIATAILEIAQGNFYFSSCTTANCYHANCMKGSCCRPHGTIANFSLANCKIANHYLGNSTMEYCYLTICWMRSLRMRVIDGSFMIHVRDAFSYLFKFLKNKKSKSFRYSFKNGKSLWHIGLGYPKDQF